VPSATRLWFAAPRHHDLFWPKDAAEILRIPIDEQMEDWPAWHFDAKGLFSVKSAYKLVVAVRDNI
jgi:hypothetical protein